APNHTSGGFTYAPDGSSHLINDPKGGKGNGHNPPGQNKKHQDPLFILDANKGIVDTPGTPTVEFSNQSMDLRAQVSGATVNSYSWNTSLAQQDITGVSGANTYNLKFTWANFSGDARAEIIGVTETAASGSAITQTVVFDVFGTNSP